MKGKRWVEFEGIETSKLCVGEEGKRGRREEGIEVNCRGAQPQKEKHSQQQSGTRKALRLG